MTTPPTPPPSPAPVRRDATPTPTVSWAFWGLTAILFLSYLCVALPLPVLPLYVTRELGFGNGWAGLTIGIAFFATILSRGTAGQIVDRRGAKPAVALGLALYGAGALILLIAGLIASPPPAFSLFILLTGRLLVGLGESLVGVGVITWGVGLLGPDRSGQVMALVGAAIYGALALGGPLGLFLVDHIGFTGTMAICATLPALGLPAIWMIGGGTAQGNAGRPSFLAILGQIAPQCLIVSLQGIGFALIGAFFVLHVSQQNWGHAGLGLSAFGGGFVLVRLCHRSLVFEVRGIGRDRTGCDGICY